MAKEGAGIKMLSVEEATALIPQVLKHLASLRNQRSQILRTQAQIEIEELTGTGSNGELSPAARAALTTLMETFEGQTKKFERELETLSRKGAQLKDLDSGLVDFYSLRGNEVVFLCWKEGETEITHWHSLEGGFRNRRSL